MPTRPGPAVLARTSAWDHPASSLPALAASHAFNHSVTFIIPLSGEGGIPTEAAVAAADALAPHPPPPPCYALRACPAALASPEFAAWAFPDTYGVVPEEAGEEGGQPMEVDGDGAAAADGPSRHRRRHPPFCPPARGAAALAVPGCLDAAGAAALLPRGRLLLTVPAAVFRRLGLPGVRLATPGGGGGGGAGSLGRARRGTGGGNGHSAGADASATAWYAIDTPLTGTRRAAAPGGPRAKAADRLAGSAGQLDWLVVGPPPPPGEPGAPPPPPSSSSSPPPPPHIPGLHRVAPVEAGVVRATLPAAVPVDWEAAFYGGGGRVAGGGAGAGGTPGPSPDPAAAAAALDWVGAVVAAAGGLVMGDGGDGGGQGQVPPPLDGRRSSRARGGEPGGGGGGGGAPASAATTTTALRATTWTGLLAPAFVAAALAAARAAVEAGGGGGGGDRRPGAAPPPPPPPWAAVAVSGFPHAPEAWAPRPDVGDARAVNPSQPGVLAGAAGRASGYVVVALPGGRYGVLAAGAGPDGLRAV